MRPTAPTALPTALLIGLTSALLLAAGCAKETRSSTDTPGPSLGTKTERQVAALKLIERGRARKLEGMNLSNNMYRRGGPNRIDVIRDGEDMIQKGKRLKAEADALPG